MTTNQQTEAGLTDNPEEKKEPEIVLSGKVNEAQITQWKSQHGYVNEVQVFDKVGYLKPITLPVLRLANSHLRSDVTKFAEAIASGCWLGGDKGIYENAEYVMPFADELSRIINGKMSLTVKH